MDQQAVEVVADIAASCGRCAAQRAAVFIEPALIRVDADGGVVEGFCRRPSRQGVRGVAEEMANERPRFLAARPSQTTWWGCWKFVGDLLLSAWCERSDRNGMFPATDCAI